MDAPPVDVVDRHRAVVVEVEADLCDRCGHRAFLYAELPPSVGLPNGGTLAYCGHHGTLFIDGLARAGAKIIDLRHLIGK